MFAKLVRIFKSTVNINLHTYCRSKHFNTKVTFFAYNIFPSSLNIVGNDQLVTCGENNKMTDKTDTKTIKLHVVATGLENCLLHN